MSISLISAGRYSTEWIRDFYDQTGIWWGSDSEVPEEDMVRAGVIERLCGPGKKRVLELGCGAGHTAAATADCGHEVTGVDISPRRISQAQELLQARSPSCWQISTLSSCEASLMSSRIGMALGSVRMPTIAGCCAVSREIGSLPVAAR